MSRPPESARRTMEVMLRMMEGPKLTTESIDALPAWAKGKEPLDEPIRAALVDALSELRVRKTLV